MSNFKGASDFAVLDSQLTFTTNHYYHQFQDGEPELAQRQCFFQPAMTPAVRFV
jgi:hypothetical protein